MRLFETASSVVLLKLPTLLKIHNDLILQWIVVRSLHSFFSTYLLPLILSIIPYPSHSSSKLIGSVLMVFHSINWFSSYVYLSSHSRLSVSINDSISTFFTLSCGVPCTPRLRTWPTPFTLYTTPLGSVISKNSLNYHFYADNTHGCRLHLFHSYEFCSIS